jgi:hypothetical protein
MKARKGPYPSPSAIKQWAANAVPPLLAVVSGELTTNISGAPLGACGLPGTISDVWFSVEASGKDDTNTLSMTIDVKKNGTTVLSTAPIIAHVSGEASQQKTTKTSTDTGVTQAVLTNTSVSQGDVFTYDMALTRTSSPTTEMHTFAVVVEFEPVS